MKASDTNAIRTVEDGPTETRSQPSARVAKPRSRPAGKRMKSKKRTGSKIGVARHGSKTEKIINLPRRSGEKRGLHRCYIDQQSIDLEADGWTSARLDEYRPRRLSLCSLWRDQLVNCHFGSIPFQRGAECSPRSRCFRTLHPGVPDENSKSH